MTDTPRIVTTDLAPAGRLVAVEEIRSLRVKSSFRL